MDTNTDNEIKVEIATDDKGNLNPVDRELAAGLSYPPPSK